MTRPVDEVVGELDEQGFSILPDVLTRDEAADARAALLRAAEASEARGIPTRMDYLDPGGRNVRIYDLVEYDPTFAALAGPGGMSLGLFRPMHGPVAEMV